MTSSERSRTVSVLLTLVVVVVVSIATASSVSARQWPSPRHSAVGARGSPAAGRQRGRRGVSVDDVRRMLSGVEDARQLRRLTELASQDMVAAVLEYNEMVLNTAAGNGSEAHACWMRLNYNVTTTPGGFTDLFRDQVIVATRFVDKNSLFWRRAFMSAAIFLRYCFHKLLPWADWSGCLVLARRAGCSAV